MKSYELSRIIIPVLSLFVDTKIDYDSMLKYFHENVDENITIEDCYATIEYINEILNANPELKNSTLH